MKKIISWDFDDTLYDQASGRLYADSYELFKKQSADNDYIVVITTYRNKSDAAQIKEMLGNPFVVATGDTDKVAALMDKFPMLEVEIHYDDDVFTVNDFEANNIGACLVYDPDDADTEETLSMVNPGVQRLKIDKSRLV